MTQATARAQAESLLRFLEQRVERLESFHIGNYRLVLNDFVDWFVRDDVVGILAQALFRRLSVDAAAWYAQAQREGACPPLPEDRAACMAFRLMAMRLVRREKVDLRFFITNLFPGSHLNEKLMHYKRLVVHPFAEDCRTLARDLIPRLPEGDWVDFDALVGEYLDGPFQQAGFGPRAWTDADDERVEADEKPPAAAAAPSPAAPSPAEPPPGAPSPEGERLAGLREAVSALPEGDARHDLLLDVEALTLELARHVRMPERILARLDAMAAHPGLREPCAALRSSV